MFSEKLVVPPYPVTRQNKLYNGTEKATGAIIKKTIVNRIITVRCCDVTYTPSMLALYIVHK